MSKELTTTIFFPRNPLHVGDISLEMAAIIYHRTWKNWIEQYEKSYPAKMYCPIFNITNQRLELTMWH